MAPSDLDDRVVYHTALKHDITLRLSSFTVLNMQINISSLGKVGNIQFKDNCVLNTTTI